MKHGFAIICEARKGHRQGIEFLALVDRSKTTKRWWTSDDSSLILQINDVAAADRIAFSYKYNSPEVVSFEEAERLIDLQADMLAEEEAQADLSWDAHKLQH